MVNVYQQARMNSTQHDIPRQSDSPPAKVAGIGNEEGQKNHNDNVVQMEKNGAYQQEIEYLYLDFDTPLPSPVGISSLQKDQQPPLKCPDLKQYASPFLWPKARKAVITLISCCVTAMSAYAAGEYSPPSKELMDKWDISQVVYNLGITLFTLGFGIAPMVLAPFSEINGRRPIFVLSGLVFTGWLSLLTAKAWLTLLMGSVLDWMWSYRILCGIACGQILFGHWRVYVGTLLL